MIERGYPERPRALRDLPHVVAEISTQARALLGLIHPVVVGGAVNAGGPRCANERSAGADEIDDLRRDLW